MSSSLYVPVTHITDIKPHPNADRLEIAEVLGWQCVIPKDSYQVGQKVVYFPPDTMISEEWAKEFGVSNYLSWSKTCQGKGRVRCAKLRGEPSFGFIVIAPPDLPEGEDASSFYGVEKYEPPTNPKTNPNSGKGQKQPAVPEHPLFERYTDIENLRNFPDVFTPGEFVVVTEKLHGANSRIGLVWDEPTGLYEAVAGSRKRQRKITVPPDKPIDMFLKPIQKKEYAEALVKLRNAYENPKQVIIFGEIYGKVQKGFSYDAEDGFGYRVFDIMIDGKYLNWNELILHCAMLELPMVPFVGKGVYEFSMDTIKELSEGTSEIAGHIREGVVVRPPVERTHPKVGRVIMKYLNPNYLLGKYADSKDE